MVLHSTEWNGFPASAQTEVSLSSFHQELNSRCFSYKKFHITDLSNHSNVPQPLSLASMTSILSTM